VSRGNFGCRSKPVDVEKAIAQINFCGSPEGPAHHLSAACDLINQLDGGGERLFYI
jgi:hypothetical protein